MSKLGKFDWIFLYALAAIVDIGQFIIDLTGVGIFISEAAEPIMGVFLIIYLHFRKFPVLQKPSIFLSLLGVAGLEVITGGIAPAWIVDIWWIQRADKKDKAFNREQQNQEELFSNIVRQPLYDSNGVRRPQIQNKKPVPPKLNIAGVRPPKGGLK